VSLVLYAGHCSKQVGVIYTYILLIHFSDNGCLSMQVFTRLQRLGICLSHKATLNIVDHMGEHHDEKVLQWVQDLESAIQEMGVEVCF